MDDIVRLARRPEDAEKREHPLNRIIGIEQDEAIVITTTDIHLPRRIGGAVKRSFHSRLEEDFDDAGYFCALLGPTDRHNRQGGDHASAVN